VDIQQTAELRANAELSALAEGLTPALEVAFGSRVPRVTAEWRLGRGDRGGDVLDLRLSDADGGSGQACFTAAEARAVLPVAARLAALAEALPRVARWRRQVAEFFGRVREWCRDTPGATVTEGPVVIRGQAPGDYEMTELVVRSNGSEMHVVPRTAYYIGAEGQIDLVGELDQHTLVLGRETGWYNFPPRDPFRRRLLDRDAFLQLASDCLDAPQPA
jgi:hypothetical protein